MDRYKISASNTTINPHERRSKSKPFKLWYIQNAKAINGSIIKRHKGFACFVLETDELIVSKPSWFNYKTVIKSFRHFLQTYPIAEGKRVYLILDNAPWHKKAVRLVQIEALSEYQDIWDKKTLLFLPPYSPDLNPTEQVWRITRREVTHNTYFANVHVLDDTLDPYFATYRQPNKKLASLCSFKCKN